MIWCDHCADDVPFESDHETGAICCYYCGKLFDPEDHINNPTLDNQKGEAGMQAKDTSDTTVSELSDSKGSEGSEEEAESSGLQAGDIPGYRKTRVLDDKKVRKEDDFSDIDDRELGQYLHSAKEKEYKKMIWEAMNKDYLKEQAAKISTVAKSSDALTISKKGKKHSRGQNAPGPSTLEATTRRSSKINWEALDALSGTENKKPRTEAYPAGADAVETRVKGNMKASDSVEGEGEEATNYEDCDYAGDDLDDYRTGDQTCWNHADYDD